MFTLISSIHSSIVLQKMFISQTFQIIFNVFLYHINSACDKGYTGHNCEDMCHFPTYGVDCQSICNCTATQCDPVDGCKEQSSKYGNILNDPLKMTSSQSLFSLHIKRHIINYVSKRTTK